MAHQHDAAYVTLLMTDSYLPGAMVLGHSLRDRGAKARLAACVLIDKLSLETISELQTVYDDIIPVEQIINMQPANLYLMNRPDLISTFTKIELWKQTQYKRIVYLDADMVVLRAPNELLKMETNFAAVPDVGWPDCFNSGLLVLNPNMGDYYSLLALARRGISFDGADQGLLNMHFTDWERLSFVYNCTPNANYQYVPAYKHFQSSINAIHFIGTEKPWTQGRDYRSNSGVYGELLARWWAVYDRHYRRPVTHDQFVQPQKKVQDYVRGEETRYEPIYQNNQSQVSQLNQSSQSNQPVERRASSGYQITQPQPQPPPGIHMTAPGEDSASMERPFGDQPSIDERIDQNGYQPRSTQEQRRWSAPFAEWEPTKQPPPPNSRPEAANFPSQQYEMSESRQLFEPPAQYPEPPKDMWYSLPPEKPAPAAPPRMIFPWEERAPKATRVFPKSREPSPPPEPESAVPANSAETTTAGVPSQEEERQRSFSQTVSQALSQRSEPNDPPKPPEPPRHVFPWEARAPKATRVFAQDTSPTPPPNTRSTTDDGRSETAVAEVAQTSVRAQPDNPWDAFAQQSNKWDEDPDISRFMESFNKPRKAPVQVVHDSRSSAQGGDGTLPMRERRTSLKLTDFPTEVERPSLPVTPAPIRRPTFWGADEQGDQNSGVLPIAKGVPRQDEWVRRFTSQYLPHLPDPVLRDIGGVLHLTCQHCGQQNPIIKLEELQRKQSLLMSGGEDPIQKSRTPPMREMPESKSAEEAIEATMRAMNISHEKPKVPGKPILKEPHFEMTQVDDGALANENIVVTSNMTATGHKSPTRFNPIVLEGEAASERNTVDNFETYIKGEENETGTAQHHHTSTYHSVTESYGPTEIFSYSTSSLSPNQSRTNLQDAARRAEVQGVSEEAVADEEIISPTTIA